MNLNLVEDPWIPVTGNAGTISLSLKEIFANPKNYEDLNVSAPERIALMALLTGIKARAGELGIKEVEYLEEQKDNFNLYGINPFLQTAQAEVDEETKPLGNIDIEKVFADKNKHFRKETSEKKQEEIV